MKDNIGQYLWLVALTMLFSFDLASIQAANVYLEQSYYQDAYSIGNGKIHFKQLIFAEGAAHNYFAGNGGKCVGGESDDGQNVDGSNSFYRINNNECTLRDNKYSYRAHNRDNR